MAIVGNRLDSLRKLVPITDALMRNRTNYSPFFPKSIDWGQVVLGMPCGCATGYKAVEFDWASAPSAETRVPLRLLNHCLQSYKIDLDPAPELVELRVGGVPWDRADKAPPSPGQWIQYDAWIVLGGMPMTSIIVGYY